MDSQPLDALTVDLRYASRRSRLLNFLIDAFGCYCVMLLCALLGLAEGLEWVLDRDWLKSYDVELLALYASTSLLYFCYYALSEYYYQGKTLGKWVTKTRVVTRLGHPMDVPTVFKRNLLRYNPLDALSFLWGRDWHDRWSQTVVIDERPPNTPNTPNTTTP